MVCRPGRVFVGVFLFVRSLSNGTTFNDLGISHAGSRALKRAAGSGRSTYSTNLTPPSAPPPGDTGSFQVTSLTASGAACGITYFEGVPDPTPPLPVAHVGNWANGTFTDQGAMPATFTLNGRSYNTASNDGYYSALGTIPGMVANTENDVFMLSGGCVDRDPKRNEQHWQ